MKLLCKLIRNGGTEVEIDGTTYHFTPDKDGVHTCEVKNQAHAKLLLGIPEAYALAVDPSSLPEEEQLLAQQASTSDSDDDSDTENDLPPPPEDTDEDDGEFDMTLVATDMTNDLLNRYARSRGFNHKSKKAIADYALDNYEEALETAGSGIQPADLIRQVYMLEQAEIQEEMEEGSDENESGEE